MTAWLLTWFLQGGVIAAGAAAVLRCAPRLNAATRHLIWSAALMAVAWLGWTSSPFSQAATIISPAQAAEPIYIPSAPGAFVSTVMGVWAAIAFMHLLRVLASVRGMNAARGGCRPFPASVEARLPLWLEAKERGRRSQLMMCDTVPGATVLGLQRPCIAIPEVLVDALTPGELDQVILHEHAHVQRRDDWSRLAQTLLMSILWMNPAAVFASRSLNREREMACDEWVVARTGLPKAYARCLARAAEASARFRHRSLLSQTLVGTRHELLERVDRVLAMRHKGRRRISGVATAAACCAMAVTSSQVQTMPAFSEMAEIIVPHVPRPLLSFYGAPGGAPYADVAFHVPVASSASAAPSASIPSAALTAPITRITTIASVTPVAPVSSPDARTLPGRTFGGAYPASQSPAAASVKEASPWRAMATPAVEIASAAKKTSVGLADAFGRAGVALARSF